MIVLTGATGNIGSALLTQLAGQGVRARALAHSAVGRDAIEAAGHEAVDGDLDDPDTISRAVEGCEQMLLLSPPHPDQARREKAAVDSARSAGVSRVVAVSMMGADPASPSALGRWHAEIDDHLDASGMERTILRPAGYMQTHLLPVPTIRAEGRWYGMTGDGAASFIDAADIAAAAVAALTSGGGTREVDLTGPVAITMPEAAAELAEVIGRPVEYVDVPADGYRASLVAAGLPDWLADAIITQYQAVRAGHLTTVTDGVERLTGRPARTYREFAVAHRGDVSG